MRNPPGAACCPASFPEMGIRPSAQALELLEALLLGVGLGLGYDLLRPPRRRSGRLGGSLLDLLFALLAGAAAFLSAMNSSGGRTGLWELSATLLGFLLYLYALSPAVLPLLEGWYRVMFNTMGLFKKIEKNLWKSAKKTFQTRKNGLL